MTISLEGRVQWRKTAPYHVQLQLERQQEDVTVPREVVVFGRVVRVFRSDGQLKIGDNAAFTVWLCQPGDEPTGPPFIYYPSFKQATHIEAYLCGKPPNCELAGYEFALIVAPSDEPNLTVSQLAEWAESLPMPLEARTKRSGKTWWKRVLRMQ